MLYLLPNMQHICAQGCPLLETAMASLEAKHPKTSFQTIPKGTMWENYT